MGLFAPLLVNKMLLAACFLVFYVAFHLLVICYVMLGRSELYMFWSCGNHDQLFSRLPRLQIRLWPETEYTSFLGTCIFLLLLAGWLLVDDMMLMVEKQPQPPPMINVSVNLRGAEQHSGCLLMDRSISFSLLVNRRNPQSITCNSRASRSISEKLIDDIRSSVVCLPKLAKSSSLC